MPMNLDVLDWLDEVVYIADMETQDLLYMNDKGRTYYNIVGNQYLGQKCYHLLQQLDSPCPFCSSSSLCEESFYQYERYSEPLDRYFCIKSKKITHQGRPCRLELAADITDSKRASARSQQHYQALMISLLGTVCRLDETCQRVDWYNDSYLDFIGYTKEQFENELKCGLGYLHPEDLCRVPDIAEQTRSTGQPVSVTIRFSRSDGEPRTMLATLAHCHDTDNNPCFYSMGVDITDYTRQQEAEGKSLLEALEAAKKANQAKSRFLSRMSHELRTPLNGIIGMAHVASISEGSPGVQRELQQKISASAKYLLTLFNDILDISNIETNSFSLTPRPFLLADLLSDISALYALEARERKIAATLTLDYFPEESFYADMQRLKQVLGNLLSNALKFTSPGGTVNLHTRRYALEPGTAWVEFTVRDSGTGISREFMEHIYTVFEQEDATSTSRIQGVGLGLPISKHIINLMRGTLDIRSAKDVGTECVVRVPLGLLPQWHAEISSQYREHLASIRLLLVDDVRSCANMTRVVAVLGMPLDTALSGVEALEMLAQAEQRGQPYTVCMANDAIPDLATSGLAEWGRNRKDHPDTQYAVSCNLLTCMQSIRLQESRSTEIKRLCKPYLISTLLDALHAWGLAPQREEREEIVYDFSGKRVLLVEDNGINREVASELLSRTCNFSVDTAEDGQKAVDMFSAHPTGYYDLVLMDIRMPVMDGLEATRRIRANATCGGHEVPIVALSANAFDEDRERSRQSGMNAHMAKPIDMNALCPVLARLLVD